MIDDDSSLASSEADERLQLMLLCCHPAIGPDAQVALTLRLVGGLTTAEIAAASLVPEATLAQRIVRAKQKIKMANIPMSMPESINSRLGALCSVLYLIFNEGYLSSSESRAAVRVDLAEEAIRLTRVTRHLVAAAAESDAAVPDPLMAQDGNAEVEGLLALQLFQWARLGTRLDGRGDLVLLEDQDRTKWDRHAIAEANNLLRTAMQRFQPGPYQLQAVIAGHHANARTAADTDWPTIAGLYGQLVAVSPSPITELNRAVAVAMADGPVVGLAMVDAISGLDDYHLLHATRGELLFRAGDATAAFAAFDEARRHARHPAERRHLERRRAAVSRL